MDKFLMDNLVYKCLLRTSFFHTSGTILSGCTVQHQLWIVRYFVQSCPQICPPSKTISLLTGVITLKDVHSHLVSNFVLSFQWLAFNVTLCHRVPYRHRWDGERAAVQRAGGAACQGDLSLAEQRLPVQGRVGDPFRCGARGYLVYHE